MSVQQQIQARIQVFVTELEALIRSAAIEAVRGALDPAGSRPAAASRRRQTTSPRAPSPVATPASSAGKPALSFKRRKGTKRTQEQLAQIDAAIVSYVKANGGKGIEDMAKALGAATHDLKLRVALLVVGRKLKKTGVKRATKYSAS